MIPKIVGFIFTVASGFLLAIGLTSEFVMPQWWWVVALLFLCVGIMGIFFSDDGDQHG
jgi:hypothetical protein